MSAKPARALSPLLIADGLVHGWAFDIAHPQLTLALTVEGIECAGGLTGFPVEATFLASAVPPVTHCGFRIPLPLNACDGWNHRIGVKVREWSEAGSEAELTWHDGKCFGEVVRGKDHYEGWVGFRRALGGKVPDVLVCEGTEVRAVIHPTVETQRSVDGSHALIKFRVERSAFADVEEPAFTCEGRTLPLKTPGVRYKVGGEVTHLDADGIRGWIFNAANPRDTLDVVLVVDGLPHSVHRPNQLRPDIARLLDLPSEAIGICGFDFSLPAVLKDGQVHAVSLRCRADGTALNAEPLLYRHRRAGFGLDQALALLPPGLDSRFRGNDGMELHRHSRESGNPALKRRKPKASIIVLNRNGASCLDDLFTSFQTHNTIPVEWIVIDHASTDTSLDILEHWRHRLPLRIVALQENHSFASSCNRGAAMAKAPALLFLNNDIIWLHDALPVLLASLEQDKVGAVGLRLLKTQGSEDGALASHTQDNTRASPMQTAVQHLGVRFTLVGAQYWPYEVTPEHTPLEAQYSPRHAAAVTGAVLLCKRKAFEDAGGFDERYFYGYEDVEFCLRLHAQGLTSLCRNDLTALHRHGYTRLSGREAGVLARQAANQQQLADTLGLYLKRAYWQSLLAGDGIFAGESLTVGFALDRGGADTTQLRAATELALALQARYPKSRARFLQAGEDWNYVEECHVLVALSPHYDLRDLKFARADLRTALYVYDAASISAWAENPSLTRFDRCLFTGDAALAAQLQELSIDCPPRASCAEAPLGDLLDENLLRIGIAAPTALPQTVALASALKRSGALVHFTAEGSNGTEKVAEVIVTRVEGAENAAEAKTYTRRGDLIDVAWLAEGANPDTLPQADVLCITQDDLAALPERLKQHLNTRLAAAFAGRGGQTEAAP